LGLISVTVFVLQVWRVCGGQHLLWVVCLWPHLYRQELNLSRRRAMAVTSKHQSSECL